MYYWHIHFTETLPTTPVIAEERGERREEVRTKRRSRRGRLRGRGTQTQLLSLQSQCRNLMKVLMGKREGDVRMEGTMREKGGGCGLEMG